MLVVTCEHVECGNVRIDMCHRLPIGVKNGLKNQSGFSTICCTLHAVRRREANLIVWGHYFGSLFVGIQALAETCSGDMSALVVMQMCTKCKL